MVVLATAERVAADFEFSSSLRRHPGSGERLCRLRAERLGGVPRLAAGDVGRGMPEVLEISSSGIPLFTRSA